MNESRVNDMKIQLPKPFYFEGTAPYAALLLHGFTGNSSDVRQLGRYLQKHNITSMAPHYEGHAEDPQKILESSPYVWWSQVNDAYEELRQKGFESIFVFGVSLGGVYALRLAAEKDITGIATICSPMFLKEDATLFESFKQYARTFKKLEGKDDATTETEVDTYIISDVFTEIREIIETTKDRLDNVYEPALVVQSKYDDVINPESANIIYDNIASDDKSLMWLDKSGHVPTIDVEKDILFKRLHEFMEEHYQ